MIARETIADQVARYCRRVMSGEQVASSFVRGAVARHLRDLDRVTDPEFLYEFNCAKAYKACAFFPTVLRHSIGEWSGHPFELSDWQQFVVWCLFGWVQKSDQMRRFRRAYISVARKNGKSTLVAGIGLLTLHLDGEDGAQVFVAATKREQAAIIHGEAEKMTKSSPSLARISTVHKHNLAVLKTNSFMRPVSSDKPYDGLNPHCVLCDELHAWTEQHRKFRETITSGSGARRQPLFVDCTTAGDDKSWIWIETNKHAQDVATGAVQDDRLFAFVAQLDDDDGPFDEEVWEKANPNLGVSVKLDYLRSQAEEARHKPSYRRAWLRYHCNRMISNVNSPITREMWDAARGELSDWSQADAVGVGIDLGGRDDLAAWGSCARFVVGEDEDERPIYRYEIRARAFVAEHTKRNLEQQPWERWIYDGLLTKSPTVSLEIQEEVAEYCDRNYTNGVAVDPHNARQLMEELQVRGIPVASMPQNCNHFNEPLKVFLDLLAAGRITHDGHEVLAYAARNVAIIRNFRDEVMPDKGHSKDKIDPFVAVLMAFRMAYFAAATTYSYYKSNSLETG